MPYTEIAAGVPTSTSYVPPDGVGSWKGIVHTFKRTRPGGYIRNDSAKDKTKQINLIFMEFLRQNSAFLSLFHMTAHCDIILFNQTR